jgi:hypothetical protein
MPLQESVGGRPARNQASIDTEGFMLKRTFGPVGLAGVVAACAFMALPAVASAASTTRVTIQAEQGGFFGLVKSVNHSCESGRKVTVYKQKGSTHNLRADTKIRADIAQPNGPHSMWSINTTKTGKFYAHVNSTSRCTSAYSKTVNSE